MWYKKCRRQVLRISHKARVCQTDGWTDGQTDRITTPKTALAQLRRAVKISHVTLVQIAEPPATSYAPSGMHFVQCISTISYYHINNFR